MEKRSIGQKIAFLRREKGVTQEALAQALGVTNQSVSKWESEQCCPDITLLPPLAGYFGVTTDMLLGADE
jgi:transcriptional regulator with XRE-family HTH domain